MECRQLFDVDRMELDRILPAGWRTQEGNKAADCVDNNDIWSAERSAMWKQRDEKWRIITLNN